VLVISRSMFLSIALATATALFIGPYPAKAQQGAAKGAQATWKDQAESDLYQALSKETDPQKKIALFQQWKEKYPSSQMGQYFVGQYVLAIQALTAPIGALFATPTPTADQQAAAQKAADYVTANGDTLFAADRKPPQATDAQWAEAKKAVSRQAGNVPGYVAMVKKDYPTAEAAFTKSLQDDPQQAQSGQLSYWLAQILYQEKKYPQSIYEYARAASYDGPGALPPAGRTQVQQNLEKMYTAYHGKDGLDELMATAKTSAVPPPDFKLPSKREMAEQKVAQENAAKEKLAAANPSLALWMSIKEALTGDQAQSYFDEHMKGTEIPMEFKGKLIEAKPETHPKELVLAIADGTTPDATIKFETPLRGKMEPGAEIGFKNGVAESYAANPFMVTFNVDKDNLTGWKGVVPAPVRHAPAKKAAPKKK
jgi:tetratricopeptide (TPR) repeat protein